jgi:tRNA(fMet)-specific endonuclease VapC
MHLLDSDTLSHLHAGHPQVVANLRAVDDPEVATTIVTKIEILRARYDFLLKASDGNQLLVAQHWLLLSEELLTGLSIIPFDAAAAREFDRLRRDKKLKRIGRADLLIASITLANHAVLVTRNLRHFGQVPNLHVVNWVDS